jgi:hypothetical protein
MCLMTTAFGTASPAWRIVVVLLAVSAATRLLGGSGGLWTMEAKALELQR